jgi:lipopolysaccharide export system permease protein
MKNTIYKYFFHEFIRYFAVVIFALTAVIWTIQAVNFLDLVTDDGHAFLVYFFYSLLTLSKIITKLFPFSFLIASILTILKFEKDNELIILWTSGLNKIHIVNLMICISLIMMLLQLTLTTVMNPQVLNFSRSLLKNSQLQFVGSLLKEKQFNDTVKGLTIFVDKKLDDGSFENIFIRDEGSLVTNVSDGASTIYAKSGFIGKNKSNLVLIDGNMQRAGNNKDITIVKFKKTVLNLSGLSTKTTSEPKIQETSTKRLIECLDIKNLYKLNCLVNSDNIELEKQFLKQNRIEVNKRFGMPIFIPLIGLVSCFLLSKNREKRMGFINKYLYFIIGFVILVASEITVRYSGNSINHAALYYSIPIILLPLIYFYLIRVFKYENLN